MASQQNRKSASVEKIVPFQSAGRPAYVLSDLHLAAGLNTNGNYDGTENFFYDQSFVRFIDHLREKTGRDGALLIINGDFIDFSRITNIPQSEDDFRNWQKILDKIGLIKSIDDLKASVVKKERQYGLKTHDYKSVWKLHVCMEGHRPLFTQLAHWVNDGNELIIVKGNHDLEWYWPAVQRYLREALKEEALASNTPVKQQQKKRTAVSSDGGETTSETLSPPVVPLPRPIGQRIHFVDHALTIDNKIHIEHGHLYEKTTVVVGEPTVNNGQELNYPFGSFFNRYLINRLELSYPFLDNVRPSQNILPVLLRERFPLAIKVLFRYIPLMLLIIPKKIYWHTFKYLLNIIFIILLPVGITLYALYTTIFNGNTSINTTGIPKFALNILQSFGFLFLSYIFGRILAWAGLKPPPSFSGEAERIVAENPSLEAVLFGHTHNPEQKKISGGRWYFNTGTWIPVFETSSADVRMDKTYTFIAINCNEKPACRERLQRWNDDAGRIDSMQLNDKI